MCEVMKWYSFLHLHIYYDASIYQDQLSQKVGRGISKVSVLSMWKYTFFFDVWELPKEITGTMKVHSLMVPYSVLYEGGIDVGPASI